MRAQNETEIESLSHEDARYLWAAEGWLELGDFVSASDELEEITATERAHWTNLADTMCRKTGGAFHFTRGRPSILNQENRHGLR